VLGPAPRLVLAMALHENGRAEEARKTLAEAILAHDWRAVNVRDQDGWIVHVGLAIAAGQKPTLGGERRFRYALSAPKDARAETTGGDPARLVEGCFVPSDRKALRSRLLRVPRNVVQVASPMCEYNTFLIFAHAGAGPPGRGRRGRLENRAFDDDPVAEVRGAGVAVESIEVAHRHRPAVHRGRSLGETAAG
jgi:hypothetical protein